MPLAHTPEKKGEAGACKTPTSPITSLSDRLSKLREASNKTSTREESSKHTWKMLKEKNAGIAGEPGKAQLGKVWTGDNVEKLCESETCKKMSEESGKQPYGSNM